MLYNTDRNKHVKGGKYMRNYYQILGIRVTASQSDIKKAYRNLMKKYHPDIVKNSKADMKKLQEIMEAYKVLSDVKERKRYDEWGHEGYLKHGKWLFREHSYTHTSTYGESHSHEGHGHDHEHGECSGDCENCSSGHDHSHEDGHCGACGSRGPAERKKPAPGTLRSSVSLTYEETFMGAEKTIELNLRIPCVHCQGQIYDPEQSPAAKCPYCHGHGYIRKKISVRISLPPRTYEGCFFPLEEILCENEKEKILAQGVPNIKNIVIIILLKDQAGYQRKSCHLYSSKLVEYTDLVLGGTIQVDTIEGPVSYQLPPGTKDGTRIRLEGKGLWMPPTVGNRGDLHITLHVNIPQALNPEQLALLKAFQESPRVG